MSLVRLQPGSNLNDDGGRGQLQETLEVMAQALKLTREELALVREADRIVAPIPIEEFPVAAGQIYTGRESLEIGMIIPCAFSTPDAGYLACDGTAVSRTTYSDLFAKIGTSFGVGDGSTTFNLPDLRGRAPIGSGTGSGLTARTLAGQVGAETLPAHTHGHAHTHTHPHTHPMGHYHDIAHTHTVTSISNPGAGALGPGIQSATSVLNSDSRTDSTSAASTSVSAGASSSDTGSESAANTGAASTSSTDSTGTGSHGVMQPSLVVMFQIRYRLGPADVVQTMPINWGRVNGQWRMDTIGNFPTTSHDNLHVGVVNGRPEAVVRVTASAGSGAGNATSTIIGCFPIPYNFRKFKARGIRVRTKLVMTGCGGGTSATVVLKVSNPILAGGYLANTYTRTLNVSAGSIQDSDYVDAQLTSLQLGPDWKPGYMFRFEIVWTVPKTFTTCQLHVGFLRVDL